MTLSVGQQSAPFVHIDGARLTWAVGLLRVPSGSSETAVIVEFWVDGEAVPSTLQFEPGHERAACAFDPPPLINADSTTLWIRVGSVDYGTTADGLAVQCRFAKIGTPP